MKRAILAILFFLLFVGNVSAEGISFMFPAQEAYPGFFSKSVEFSGYVINDGTIAVEVTTEAHRFDITLEGVEKGETLEWVRCPKPFRLHPGEKGEVKFRGRVPSGTKETIPVLVTTTATTLAETGIRFAFVFEHFALIHPRRPKERQPIIKDLETEDGQIFLTVENPSPYAFIIKHGSKIQNGDGEIPIPSGKVILPYRIRRLEFAGTVEGEASVVLDIGDSKCLYGKRFSSD